MIRVVVADDQEQVRRGFVALLGLEPDLQVVGEAADGLAAVGAASRTRPDVVLMDIRMPGIDGLEATRRILADPDLGGTRVIVLTTFDLDEYVFAALSAGASGFLLKHTDPAEMVHGVRVVARGDALLSPSVTRTLIGAFASRPSAGHADPAYRSLLTEREAEAVALVAAGASNAEIAGQWFVSEVTVRTHVSRAMTKLGARDRAQLVVLAYQHGLAQPPQHPQ
ncbi:response regulator transcription factor [Calidifontibacter sp. DB0510]|uniref:Response regulator transcription factor n=1 Tax=Metallococcus carri TaxID=1656884 RepID=A0A967ED93_9MICO|nr:response regulator transcription factor [Metallococcus carri]NHN54496.1 response regulator transcription factor [Metallococcus carri]NOP36665.1 response regulator transcription factor [Calidifontibacter sp. DB2511S]